MLAVPRLLLSLWVLGCALAHTLLLRFPVLQLIGGWCTVEYVTCLVRSSVRPLLRRSPSHGSIPEPADFVHALSSLRAFVRPVVDEAIHASELDGLASVSRSDPSPTTKRPAVTIRTEADAEAGIRVFTMGRPGRGGPGVVARRDPSSGCPRGYAWEASRKRQVSLFYWKRHVKIRFSVF